MAVKHDRKSIRLPEYDYSSGGGYFITLCCHQKQPLFGQIVDEDVLLSRFGEIVKEEWIKTEQIRPGVQLDEFIIMPDHFHAILFFSESLNEHAVGAHSCAPLQQHIAPQQHGIQFRQPRSLGSLVAGFKSAVTTRINILHQTPGEKVWQRNYYEYIIRDEKDLEDIREYILNNPRNQ